MRQLEIHGRSSEHTFASAPGLLITAWGGNVTPALVTSLDRVIRRLIAVSEGGRYSAVTVIEGTISMRFEDDARAQSAALQRRFAEHMRCQAYLVEGVGFLPAAVRTITAGLQLMTKAPYPVNVFRDTEPLASWVAAQGGLHANDVARWVAEIRA